MDRSNFNPDQLHEHFDRLQNDLGIELEDNARMIKFPTGHRFVLGKGAVLAGKFGTPTFHAGDTIFPLLTEAGEVGELHTFVNPAESMASITFDRDRETEPGKDRGTEPGPVPSRRVDHRVEWANELTTPLSVPLNNNRTKWYINPDSNTMDSIMKEVTERGGSIHPETLQGAGTVVVDSYSYDYGKRTARDEPLGPVGTMAMNRKSGRFEWIPD